MESYAVSLLIIFWRIAPAFLLSSSGYSLAYKFLCFLDKSLANIYLENTEQNVSNREGKEVKISSNPDNKKEKDFVESSPIKTISNDKDTSESYIENTFGIKFYQDDLSKNQLNKLFNNQKVNDSILLSKISPTDIPYTKLINFLLRQIYKLFYITLGGNFFTQIFPVLILIFNEGSPLINYYLVEIVDKLESSFGNLLYYKNFKELFNNPSDFDENEKKYSENNISALRIFGLAISEINFFILGSILIFISYKKKNTTRFNINFVNSYWLNT